MADREKILKGLEYCSKTVGKACPWECPYRVECMMQDDGLHMYSVMYDALELLKEQPEQKFFVDFDGKITPLPKQKHGYWVLDPDGMDWNIPAWKCSECHCKNDNIPPNLEKTNPLRWSGSKFCPNCGAKMDEKVMHDA